MIHKLKLIIVVTLLAIVSCNKESLVEGYIPTKPVVINLDKEITKATKKDISIIIDKVNYTVNVDYRFYKAGTVEVRELFLGFSNTASSNYLQLTLKGNTNIGTVNIGELINPMFVSGGTYSGQLLYALNDIGTTNYNYYTINEVTMSKLIYIPFRTVDFNSPSISIYGYFTCKVEAEKFTINKCVYKVLGDINAGDE
jgi:hypothetical protein